MAEIETGGLLYENPLAGPDDVAAFRLEGDAAVTFPQGRMRLENRRDPAEGQAANFVYWLDRDFPSDIRVAWDFLPLREPGLALAWFAAAGRGGEDPLRPVAGPAGRGVQPVPPRRHQRLPPLVLPPQAARRAACAL